LRTGLRAVPPAPKCETNEIHGGGKQPRQTREAESKVPELLEIIDLEQIAVLVVVLLGKTFVKYAHGSPA
jgi:hypothetical protein